MGVSTVLVGLLPTYEQVGLPVMRMGYTDLPGLQRSMVATAQALGERMVAGDARIVLRTRIARQVTLGKQRFRLALELHIEDNGPGVPEAIRDRIFYPLVSGRDGGSGLGLTLAQTFVAQHQGTIECESEPGRTLFKITMPLP